ncbi:two-component system VirA-like sensor kinase [Vineibacter terrae]|uniref:two-component system VirA-like sensor kinase n=1 Tax=Vineibacter terrae TaxID=2586908 RepID=UPI002E357B01|nr:two-component system VirA-like sensor kinase [Vineibacter terrae]HEX2886503.1 two-component system VirA-like sensor kinase [Vineibacter terrae]
MKRIGRTAPVVAALLVALTWLLVRSASPDPVLHERTLDALRMLSLNNAALHRDVLRARAGLLRNYDPLVRSVDGLRGAVIGLQTLGTALDDSAGVAINRQLERLTAAVDEQEALVDAFKSSNALLQNSLSYLNHAAHQLDAPPWRAEGETSRATGMLANAMLRFTGEPTPEAAADVTAAIGRLADLPPSAGGTDVQPLVTHGRLIVATLPDVDGIITRLLSSPTDERAQALQDLYLEAHGRAAARATTFRLLLYLAAVVLAACLGHLFFRLRINARTLRERLAFENLIAETSTRFINLPLDRTAQGIDDALARLADGAGLDRAYLLLGAATGMGVEAAHGWSRQGIAALSADCRDLLLATGLRWQLPGHDRQGCIHVPSVAALPAGRERAALMACAIRSWTCVPLGRTGNRIGLLGFDMTRRERQMADDDIALLRMAGEIFVSAIEREQAAARRAALEMQLRQAQRLEALGTLAGGIAHNFNNILSAILGYAEMALAHLPRDSRTFGHVREAHRAGERARDVIDQILTFSRRAERRHQRVAMKPMLDGAIALLRASLPATIELHLRAPSADATVIGDEAQLQQVVMNLCTNAAHAMNGRGIVALELDSITFDEAADLSHGTAARGRYWCLQVRDSGHGIDPATIERIFEPFFTTKAVGLGTGLGLASVHGIVADHGGVLNVRSRPGAGSTFEVYIAAADPGDRRDDEAEPPLPHGHGETILLVDDEQPLVALGEEMLAELGYEPVGFDSGSAALAAFSADPQRFDLVIADEVMPAMTGSELALAMHRLRPDIPFILMSGGVMPIEADQTHMVGICAFLKKPLASSDIARAVARHLPPRA